MPRLRSEDHGGYSEHRIDESGRIVLSASQLEVLGDTVYILGWIEDCVRLCNAEGLEECRKFIDHGYLNGAQREWARRITAIDKPRTVSPDGNGRVRIPGGCLDDACIGRGASAALVLPRGNGVFEVWDKAHYAEVSKTMAERIRQQMWDAPAQPAGPGGPSGE